MSSASGVSDLINSITGAADTTSDNFTAMLEFIKAQEQQDIANEQWEKMYRLQKDQWGVDRMRQMQEFEAAQRDLDWQKGFRNAIMRGTSSTGVQMKGGM